MKLRFLNERGFSTKIFSAIVFFVVALGIVALKIKKGVEVKGQIYHSNNILSQYNLEYGIQKILNDKDSCRVSLAGDGPEGQPRDPIEVPLSRMQRTGMEIELWESDQSGMERGKLKYSSLEQAGREHGEFTIKSIVLIFPDGQKEFSRNTHSTVQGIIKVVAQKRISLEQKIRMHFHFHLGVKLFTKKDGQTTVLNSCATVKGHEKSKRIKEKNVLIGKNAGVSIKTGEGNIFIGKNTGARIADGTNNIVIGDNSGVNNISGHSNIYIGSNIDDKKNDHSMLNIGHLIMGKMPKAKDKNELSGEDDNSSEVIINGNLTVQGTISPASSRRYKLNIEPFNNVENSWDDILEVPFFTYRHGRDEPQKKRLGIVAEELPDKFQIEKSEGFILPDWVSLQGSFWAGIKALIIEFKDLKKKADMIEKNKQNLEKTQKELENLRRELRELRRSDRK